jgi:hypothetical protein
MPGSAICTARFIERAPDQDLPESETWSRELEALFLDPSGASCLLCVPFSSPLRNKAADKSLKEVTVKREE